MVIDPMHCILLGTPFFFFSSLLSYTVPPGLGKNQWFHRWIEMRALRPDTDAGTRRELAVVQDFLQTVRSAFLAFRLYLMCDAKTVRNARMGRATAFAHR
jgi:hypothetical protein